jgi:endonuclease/exonuclease/phosphatase family metal-dependent hydrolase
MSQSVREKQAEELIQVVRARDNPVIIMGDLNTGWHQQDSTTRYLSRELGLTAFQPQNAELVTFPALGERLDWILVSPGLEFRSHDIIGSGVSDHRGVVAEIVLSGRHLVDARD